MRVLRSGASHFSKYGSWHESFLPGFADLLSPFRQFQYHHPDQEGGTSLKSVLPAMTGEGCEGLEIPDGEAAGFRFREMAFGKVLESRKKAIHRALADYCHPDTEGMIEILKELQRLCR
jgi:hypothetical protein